MPGSWTSLVIRALARAARANCAASSFGCFALVVAAFIPSGAGAVPCGASRIFKNGYSGTVSIPTFATVYDTTIADSWVARLAFDRTVGRATLSASSSGAFDVRLRVVECLDVIGVPAGTALDATLQFVLSGYSAQNCGGSGCGVVLQGTVAVGADSASANANQGGPGGGTVPLQATISVPIHFVAGSPVTAHFVLIYGTGPGGGGGVGEAVGTWRVAGLPAGIRAIGATGADLTPTGATTWGRLKSIYR